jgi:hypothetical protein
MLLPSLSTGLSASKGQVVLDHLKTFADQVHRHVGIIPGGMGGVKLPGVVLARDSGGAEMALSQIYR